MDIPRLNHGAIGNGRVLALVSPTSAIEWLCLPRFDSPSLFARLLDRDRGGTFRILVEGGEIEGSMSYLENTNVLTTKFEHKDWAWEVTDFAPRIPRGLSVAVPIEVIRLVRPLRGQPRLRVEFDPRPDYGRATAELIPATDGVEIRGGPGPIYLFSSVPTGYLTGRQEFVLSRPAFFVIRYGSLGEPPTWAEVNHDLEVTVAGWRAWAKTCALPAIAPRAVLRSALCLKLHAYHDTGAIIAAATTSVPEAMGTPRTWDYRYCWLRDAAFVIEALRRLSHLNEGEQFLRYLRDVVETGELQPVYGIGGESDLREELLPHLAGFGGNGHVRFGNAASEQRQNDLMGEMMLCLETLLTDPRIVSDPNDDYWPLISKLVERAITMAPEPDTGIWEFRSTLRHYTFSRAMCWVAIDRGATLARGLGRPDLAARWGPIAEAEREEVLRRGYNADLGFFTQSLDGTYPDASNLLLPMVGLVDPKDARFVSTIDAYQRLLRKDGLILRYRNADDFGETTSAFTICSFWFAESLALMGRLDEAIDVFHGVTKYANPVGLFSEDVELETGRLLGNFPQAYTHVGLIHAATTIGELIDARDGPGLLWR
jgi:GH15 family glucan-1,4-alpha-glucosidase